MTFTENDRLKEAPAVTTVNTMGLLLSRPMSMYTKETEVTKNMKYCSLFTVRSRESAASCRYWSAPAHNELVILTLVVRRLRLAEHHVLHVQPDLADIRAALVDGQPTGAHTENNKIKYFIQLDGLL